MANYTFTNCTVKIIVTPPIRPSRIKQCTNSNAIERLPARQRATRRPRENPRTRGNPATSDEAQDDIPMDSLSARDKRPAEQDQRRLSKRSNGPRARVPNPRPQRANTSLSSNGSAPRLMRSSTAPDSGQRTSSPVEVLLPNVTSSSSGLDRQNSSRNSAIDVSLLESDSDDDVSLLDDNPISGRDLPLDKDGILFPLIRSSDPENSGYLKPLSRSRLRANLIPRELLMTSGPFEGCPFDNLEDNRLRSVVNYCLKKEMLFFVQFVRPFLADRRYPVYPRVPLKLSVVLGLEPKWMLVDFLRAIYLFDSHRWNYIKSALERENFDFSYIITAECQKALEDYQARRQDAGHA